MSIEELPKFSHNNPSNKEEKLIVELMDSLRETMIVFMRLNYPGDKPVNQELFIILRDSSIGYASGMIRDLVNLMADKSQVKCFLDEARDIFESYLKDIK